MEANSQLHAPGTFLTVIYLATSMCFIHCDTMPEGLNNGARGDVHC
jgi:hypothetical protein